MSSNSMENNPHELKERLLDEYNGKSLDELEYGENLKTSLGSCHIFKKKETLKLETLKKKDAKHKMICDLKLLPGIGQHREVKLKKEGYNSMKDLAEHPQFGKNACMFLEILDSGDINEINSWIINKYSGTHPSNLLLSALKGNENFLFMDIETLGFKNVPLILIGVGEITDDGIGVSQYLVRDLKEENAVLKGFISHTNKENIFVTFNGLSFDLPFIKSRMTYFGIKKRFADSHLDLLHFSRRRWGDELPNCRLQTLEKYLFGMERCDDVPSSHVPEFYLTYRETGNIGPLVPIIDHNRDDVITLAKILSLLNKNLEI